MAQAVGGGAGHAERCVGAGGPKTPFERAAEPVLVLDEPDDRPGIDRQPALGEAQGGAGGAGGGGDDGGDVGSGLQRVASGADPVGGMLGDEPGERARRAGGRFRRLHRGNDCAFVRPSGGHSRDHQTAATGVEGGPGDSREAAGTGLKIYDEGVEVIRVDPVDGDVEASLAGPHCPGPALAGGRPAESASPRRERRQVWPPRPGREAAGF